MSGDARAVEAAQDQAQSRDVLLVALGTAGDVHPFVALGRDLRSRGHRATVVANGHFEPVVRRAGLDFVAVGTADEYRSYIASPALWDPIRCIGLTADRLILGPLRRTFEIIRERNVPGETVVAAPLTAFGARIAQEALGVPLISVALQPASIRSAIGPPALARLPFSRRMPRAWNRLL